MKTAAMLASLEWSFTFGPLVASGGVVLASLLAARSASAGLTTRRRLESTEQFLQLFAAAHGRPADRSVIGLSEQVAAVHLIAEFGDSYEWLRRPAVEGLRSMEGWVADVSDERSRVQLSAAVRDALGHLGRA